LDLLIERNIEERMILDDFDGNRNGIFGVVKTLLENIKCLLIRFLIDVDIGHLYVGL